MTQQGARVLHDTRIGRWYRVYGTGTDAQCFRITRWGNGNTKWLWLRFEDGAERAYRPSEVRQVAAPARTLRPPQP